MSEKPSCLVIMPFSKTTEDHSRAYWTSHYKTFLQPLIEECGLVAYRSEPLRGSILNKIIKDLISCPVVVADITDADPNVYWELGIRQSFKHGTVTIAKEGTKIPFEISVKGILYYSPQDHIKNAEFCKQFKNAINDCVEHPEKPDSQVLETISGRGTIYQIIHHDDISRKLDAVCEEITNNLEIYQIITETITANEMRREKGDLPRYPSARFIYSAVENLIINRYVDAPQEFYNIAKQCYTSLRVYNDQLNVWGGASPILCKDLERWFLANKERFEKEAHEFEREITRIQHTLQITI